MAFLLFQKKYRSITYIQFFKTGIGRHQTGCTNVHFISEFLNTSIDLNIAMIGKIFEMAKIGEKERDCLTSFRQFFFIKKNKAFLLKISLKAFSVSD